MSSERHTQHRLYGGPFDGHLVDLAKTEVRFGCLRFTYKTSEALLKQVDYCERSVFFGGQEFTLWVWSELK